MAANFYPQPDIRDRVSKLESLLATLQGLPQRPRLRVLRRWVLYEPAHASVLDKLRQRFCANAALPRPVSPQAIESWLGETPSD